MRLWFTFPITILGASGEDCLSPILALLSCRRRPASCGEPELASPRESRLGPMRASAGVSAGGRRRGTAGPWCMVATLTFRTACRSTIMGILAVTTGARSIMVVAASQEAFMATLMRGKLTRAALMRAVVMGRAVVIRRTGAMEEPVATEQPAAIRRPLAMEEPGAMEEPLAMEGRLAMEGPLGMEQPAAIRHP